jgi:hypothetical protein
MNLDIEQLHRDRMLALKPHERMERCAAMFQWTREMVGRRVTAEKGDMPPERLKWEVAKRIYANEAELLRLIEEHLSRVSN